MVNPLKAERLAVDHGKCQKILEGGRICGCNERLTMHHIVPRRMGGPDELDNVVIWCWKCHRDFNISEATVKRKNASLRKESKWTVDWKCKPSCTKCCNCMKGNCTNWPEGFIEALIRMLTGQWPGSEISISGPAGSKPAIGGRA